MLNDVLALLVQYQYPLATGLASVILYFAAKIPGFATLGDWTKRGALGLAAIAVVALVRFAGGAISEDLAGLLSLILGGAASALPAGVAFRFGRAK